MIKFTSRAGEVLAIDGKEEKFLLGDREISQEQAIHFIFSVARELETPAPVNLEEAIGKVTEIVLMAENEQTEEEQ